MRAVLNSFLVKSSRLYSFVRAGLSRQPFTIRGLLAVAFGMLIVEQLAVSERDLSAWIIGAAITGITLGLALIVTSLRIKLGKQLSCELYFDEAHPLSRTDVAAGFMLRGSSVPPLFYLSATRAFQHEGVTHSTHLLSGNGEERRVIDSIRFPHRGLWNVSGLWLSVGDRFGLAKFSWLLKKEQSLEVHAAQVPIRPLPIMAASSRSGDQMSRSQKRSGDLFDIKPYDPSDGIKRILWKTYARSGELVVRRPEPAILPEGEVALYVVARRDEDYVVGAALRYIESLMDQNIVVLFGTDGMQESVGELSNQAFVTEERDIERAINYAAWSRQAGTGSGFVSYLESLQAANKVLHQAVVFSSIDNQGWFKEVANKAANTQIKLSVALVPESMKISIAEENAPSLSEFARALIAKRTRVNTTSSRAFSAQIAASGNEPLLCETAEEIR